MTLKHQFEKTNPVLSDFFENLIQDTSLTNLDIVNNHIFKLLYNAQKSINMPLIIPTTRQELILQKNEDIVKSVDLPHSKSLDPPHVLKAIMGITKNWDSQKLSNI